MWFLIDQERKVIFGWSAKCGCTHVKNLFYFLQSGKIYNEIHTLKDMNSLPMDTENYEIIIFARNPMQKLVSGFLNKYKGNGEYRHMCKYGKLTFKNFVEKLVEKKWNEIEEHHFTPQTTESFNKTLIEKAKKVVVFDINEINYFYLEEKFERKIPNEVKKFKGNHKIENKGDTKEKNISEMEINEIYELEHIPYYYLFYINNLEIREKVRKFYEDDLIFFKKYNLNYCGKIKKI
jgi:hypothetical protein